MKFVTTVHLTYHNKHYVMIKRINISLFDSSEIIEQKENKPETIDKNIPIVVHNLSNIVSIKKD